MKIEYAYRILKCYSARNITKKDCSRLDLDGAIETVLPFIANIVDEKSRSNFFFQDIAERVLRGEVNGVFVLKGGGRMSSMELCRNDSTDVDRLEFPYARVGMYYINKYGCRCGTVDFDTNIVDFIENK